MANRTGLSVTLHRARTGRDLTQDQAARLIGVSRNTVANYEKDRTIPTLAILTAIAFAYRIDYGDLEEMRRHAERTHADRARRARNGSKP